MRAALQFILADQVDQVLAAALTEPAVTHSAKESSSCLALEGSKADGSVSWKQ